MRLLFPGCSSAKEQRNGGRAHLYLNVYDVSPINSYIYWFGLGIFHSGIEAHGMEYGFGAHEFPSSGVFEVEPKSCPGYIFRRTVWLGTTDMSRSEFRLFMEHLAGKYHGDTYHLISKNCNHFTNDVCKHLTGKPIPRWVNRLARLGSLFNCFLPETLQVTSVRRLPDHPPYSDDGLESVASSAMESDEEGIDQHLLLTPNSDPGYSRDISSRRATDSLDGLPTSRIR